MYTDEIIDEFNVLRQQSEIVRNAVRHMHKRTKQTIIYDCHIVFL